MPGLRVIEPSVSDCGSPTVLLPKKDESIGFCADFHWLNSVYKSDSYPSPPLLTLTTWSSTQVSSPVALIHPPPPPPPLRQPADMSNNPQGCSISTSPAQRHVSTLTRAPNLSGGGGGNLLL
ncbi:hypothetical protein AAFF_G00400270 [Aldrovandia affinis]|uniref:Uncharacterized protein n=1 Tax=Aldrovandia affinis TaxID=143900 RepID=A0AAD7WKA5_9TELE|nr:hypothetical protein AAFF_G00400270 [Aldrovandia affinis]